MTENHDPALPCIGDSRTPKTTGDLISILSRKVVGQSSATGAIAPYVYMYQSGLVPEGRPAGVFLLLGPTGAGKGRRPKRWPSCCT
jgi:ATP-dependent Clp protease ATP-binding subunit ClpA